MVPFKRTDIASLERNSKHRRWDLRSAAFFLKSPSGQSLERPTNNAHSTETQDAQRMVVKSA